MSGTSGFAPDEMGEHPCCRQCLKCVHPSIFVKVVAFDAKKFQRIRNIWNADKAKEEKTTVFLSQLGIGVTIPEPETFAKSYVEASQDPRPEFDLDYTAPSFPAPA